MSRKKPGRPPSLTNQFRLEKPVPGCGAAGSMTARQRSHGGGCGCGRKGLGWGERLHDMDLGDMQELTDATPEVTAGIDVVMTSASEPGPGDARLRERRGRTPRCHGTARRRVQVLGGHCHRTARRAGPSAGGTLPSHSLAAGPSARDTTLPSHSLAAGPSAGGTPCCHRTARGQV